jgi:hypothetical protein
MFWKQSTLLRSKSRCLVNRKHRRPIRTVQTKNHEMSQTTFLALFFQRSILTKDYDYSFTDFNIEPISLSVGAQPLLCQWALCTACSYEANSTCSVCLEKSTPPPSIPAELPATSWLLTLPREWLGFPPNELWMHSEAFFSMRMHHEKLGHGQ